MDALRVKLVEKGEETSFTNYVCGIHIEKNCDVLHGIEEALPDLIFWLIEPTRFCELVGEWLKEVKG